MFRKHLLRDMNIEELRGRKKRRKSKFVLLLPKILPVLALLIFVGWYFSPMVALAWYVTNECPHMDFVPADYDVSQVQAADDFVAHHLRDFYFSLPASCNFYKENMESEGHCSCTYKEDSREKGGSILLGGNQFSFDANHLGVMSEKQWEKFFNRSGAHIPTTQFELNQFMNHLTTKDFPLLNRKYAIAYYSFATGKEYGFISSNRYVVRTDEVMGELFTWAELADFMSDEEIAKLPDWEEREAKYHDKQYTFSGYSVKDPTREIFFVMPGSLDLEGAAKVVQSMYYGEMPSVPME